MVSIDVRVMGSNFFLCNNNNNKTKTNKNALIAKQNKKKTKTLTAIGYFQTTKDPTAHWYKNRNVVRASMKARQMVSWIFGKEDSKFRNCENLQVL